jgi:hypothetical protein
LQHIENIYYFSLSVSINIFNLKEEEEFCIFFFTWHNFIANILFLDCFIFYNKKSMG